MADKGVHSDAAGNEATICSRAGSVTSHNLHGNKAIWQASVYDFESISQLQNSPHIYRRYGCPNTDELAAAVAALEGAESGLATSSGMGAIVAAVISLCKSGDIIIINADMYGVAYEFFNVDMRLLGMDIIVEDVFDIHILEKTLEELSNDKKLIGDSTNNRTIVVFLESITNPLVKVANISSIGKICNKYDAKLIVDNTMATPLRMKPFVEGASLVVHSATKYLGGHNDLMAGVVVGSSEHISHVKAIATRWGLTATPFDSWLAIRGIHTLKVRMEHMWRSASTIADRCAMSGLALQTLSVPMCAIVCLEVYGGLPGAKKAIEAFKLIKLSPSFGGTQTNVSHSATSSHKCLDEELRMKLGVTDGILRVSVGLEDVDDIWSDLKCGLLAAYSHHQEAST